jgi:hypothetical protein
VTLEIDVGHVAPSATGDVDITLANVNTPQAIVLICTPLTADGNAADASISVGFGTYRGSVVQQNYNCHLAEDAQAAASDTYAAQNTNALGKLIEGVGGTVDFACTLVSMTSGSPGSVRLNVSNVHTAGAIRLQYMVLGGSDLLDAQAHAFNTASTGTLTVALDSGFGHPNVVLFSRRGNLDQDTVIAGADLSFGFGVLGGDNRSVWWTSQDNQANEVSSQRINTTAALSGGGSAGGTPQVTFTLAAEGSFPTDGYAYTATASTIGEGVHGLALKLSNNVTITSGQGSALTSTGTTDLAVGTSTPKGLLLLHTRQTTADTSDTTSTDAALLGIGMVDGSANERWSGVWDDDAAATSNSGSGQSTTKAVRSYAVDTDTLDTEADGLINGSNFRLDFTDPAPSAFLVAWLAFGDTSVAAVPPPGPRRFPLGV